MIPIEPWIRLLQTGHSPSNKDTKHPFSNRKRPVMVKAHVERTIDVPIERAWEILGDFSHVNKVHPLVGKVDQESSNGNGLGATRTCHMYDGNLAKETIVEWNPKEHSYVVDMIGGTLPMKSVVAKLAAKDLGNGKTKMVADMDLNMKFGLLGKIMERLVLKPKLGTAVGDLFAGIEYHEQTGKEVQKGFKASTPALLQ